MTFMIMIPKTLHTMTYRIILDKTIETQRLKGLF